MALASRVVALVSSRLAAERDNIWRQSFRCGIVPVPIPMLLRAFGPMSSSVDLASLTQGDFEPHLGDVFSVRNAAGEISLRLAVVRKLGQAKRAGGAFSLEFESRADRVLPQAIYSLEHRTLGTLALFLVPLGPAATGMIYEAVFT
jgi:hypothetical protein